MLFGNMIASDKKYIDPNLIEIYFQLGKLLKKNIALCGFDFCGCGNAEGEYVTMGYYEQQDVKEVVDYLIQNFRINSLALWGRSIGAMTTLMYLSKTHDIKAAIVDSPSRHLKSYIEHHIKKNSNLPSLVVGGAVKIVSKTIG